MMLNPTHLLAGCQNSPDELIRGMVRTIRVGSYSQGQGPTPLLFDRLPLGIYFSIYHQTTIIAMRNFAKIIELADCECLAYRKGSHQVCFHFWLNGLSQGEVLEPTATMSWPVMQVVDSLFTTHQDKLKEKAEKAWQTIKDQFPDQFEA